MSVYIQVLFEKIVFGSLQCKISFNHVTTDRFYIEDLCCNLFHLYKAQVTSEIFKNFTVCCIFKFYKLSILTIEIGNIYQDLKPQLFKLDIRKCILNLSLPHSFN